MATIAIHPGEHIAEELQALGMSAAELARRLSVPTNRITAIINGQRGITGDTALRLAHFFGTTPEFWLNLQILYDLRIAEQKAGKSIKSLPKLKRREPVSVKHRFFLCDFFAIYEARSGSACGIGTREIGITQIESGSHDTSAVDSDFPAACARDLGDEAVGMEPAEDAADCATLLLRVLDAGLQMRRGLEFCPDVAVGEAT